MILIQIARMMVTHWHLGAFGQVNLVGVGRFRTAFDLFLIVRCASSGRILWTLDLALHIVVCILQNLCLVTQRLMHSVCILVL